MYAADAVQHEMRLSKTRAYARPMIEWRSCMGLAAIRTGPFLSYSKTIILSIGRSHHKFGGVVS
jgi:hypothetical protein